MHTSAQDCLCMSLSAVLVCCKKQTTYIPACIHTYMT